MAKIISWIALTFCCAIITPPLMAEDEARIEVGSRVEGHENTSTEEAHLQLAALENEKPSFKNSQEERASEAKAARGEEGEKDVLGLFAYVSSHPGAFHNIVDSPSSHSFSIEDGSIWLTSAYIEPIVETDIYGMTNFYYLVTDGFSTSVWYPSDSIVIQPNHWSFGYDYWFKNEATGAYISAQLNLGPFYDSIYKHTILGIDYIYGYVYLEDGSIWTMDSTYSIRKWMINDTVIIGGKDSYFYSSSPNVLINVNMLQYAAGKSSF